MIDDLLVSRSTVGAAPRKRHVRRVIVSLVSLLLLLTVGAGAAYVGFLNHMVTTNIKHAALLPTPRAGESAPVRQSAAKDAQNILVIGSDSRRSVADGRSDVTVLVHISSDRKKVYLVQFPRDLCVDVPGHGKDTINAAFAYGGAPLLVRTLQNLVDVPFDHVAVIGFQGFQEGDISRGRRQEAFIKALMLQSVSKQTLVNPLRFAKLLDASTRYLTVDNDFSVADMRAEALGDEESAQQRHQADHRPLQRLRDKPCGRLDRHRGPGPDGTAVDRAQQRHHEPDLDRPADPLACMPFASH